MCYKSKIYSSALIPFALIIYLLQIWQIDPAKFKSGFAQHTIGQVDCYWLLQMIIFILLTFFVSKSQIKNKIVGRCVGTHMVDHSFITWIQILFFWDLSLD